jgi:phage-related protein
VFQIIYYSFNGNSPILEFLKALPKKDIAKILREIDLLEEFGLSLGMPHIKKLVDSEEIWELRIKFSSNNYRIFYFVLKDKQFVLLHAFQKKTDSTPKREIQTAITRKNDYLKRGE